MRNLQAEILSWKDVSETVRRSNHEIAKLIDAIGPNHTYKFIKVRYPFGAKILHQGKIHIPTKTGECLPVDDPSVPAVLQKELNYRFAPMGMISEKMVEFYFQSNNRLIPARSYQQGEIFGIWQLMDPPNTTLLKNLWNISAGARSIFLLPKISNNIAHTRLQQEHNLTTPTPRTLLDHHGVFVDIVRESNSASDWVCEVIFFGKKWASCNGINEPFTRLWNYWLSAAWQQSFYCRTQMTYNAAQETFAGILEENHIKPKPRILSTITHLLAVGEGMFPGFVPASVDGENFAPIKIIRNAYIESYRLKAQDTILMHPYQLHQPGRKRNAVYYSLAFPTLLNSFTNVMSSRSIMDDLVELTKLLKIYQQMETHTSVRYQFYHTTPSSFADIHPVSELVKHDSVIGKHFKRSDMSLDFRPPFFSGCVRISND